MDTKKNKTIEDEILEENYDPNEAMENIQEIMQKANAKCPVHKINFSVESTSSYAGLYLMTLNDPGKMLKEIGDYEALTDETYLYFEPRHIMETAQLLYGILHMLAMQNYIKKSVINPFIHDVITKVSYCTFEDFKSLQDDILIKYGLIPENAKSFNNKEGMLKAAALTRFNIIFKEIWFVPYAKIDEMANQVIKDYQARHTDENNSDSTE